MQYGIVLPISGIDGDIHRLIEFAHLAEESGWDGVFLEDYIVYWGSQGITYDPWVALAAIATHTKRVRLGLTVTPLARRRPWKLAREAITLDRLSNGRLILGFGLGDDNDKSFTSFGDIADRKQRAELLDEGLDILDGLMSGQAFSYTGKHHQVNEVTFLPQPVQKPRIPIWIGGFWPHKAPAKRAARWDGFVPAAAPDENGYGSLKPEDIRAMRVFITEHRTSTDPFDICVGGYTPGDDVTRACSQVEPLREAGATWWSEFVLPEPGQADQALMRIKQGPPRMK
jgi:alkanesulfonate monooxygenase SsuD/methylene tetrahydromethanopterin reductase-like flavin-dependent oxidoreductase (luciferase family)